MGVKTVHVWPTACYESWCAHVWGAPLSHRASRPESSHRGQERKLGWGGPGEAALGIEARSDGYVCTSKVGGLERVPQTGARRGNGPRLLGYLGKEEREKAVTAMATPKPFEAPDLFDRFLSFT